jgi:hypothetical protein
MRRVVGIVVFLASTAAAAAEPAPVAAVSRLYREFAWEAVLAQPEAQGLAQQPETVLQHYFTPKLASALAADAACASRRREICRLDFLPLWASQDPSAHELTVVQAGPGLVKVTFVTPSSTRATVLQLKVVPTRGGWRVADIVYPSGPSLAALLSGKTE